jgi:hypothetical protein
LEEELLQHCSRVDSPPYFAFALEMEAKFKVRYALHLKKIFQFFKMKSIVHTCPSLAILSASILRQQRDLQQYFYVSSSSFLSTVSPKIVEISSDISINEGNNISLTCIATGRPEPTVTWRHISPKGKSSISEVITGILVAMGGRLWYWLLNPRGSKPVGA